MRKNYSHGTVAHTCVWVSGNGRDLNEAHKYYHPLKRKPRQLGRAVSPETTRESEKLESDTMTMSGAELADECGGEAWWVIPSTPVGMRWRANVMGRLGGCCPPRRCRSCNPLACRLQRRQRRPVDRAPGRTMQTATKQEGLCKNGRGAPNIRGLSCFGEAAIVRPGAPPTGRHVFFGGPPPGLGITASWWGRSPLVPKKKRIRPNRKLHRRRRFCIAPIHSHTGGPPPGLEITAS